MARCSVADLGLVIGAGFLGFAGAGFLVFAAHGALAKAVGPLGSASMLGAFLILLSAVVWLMMWKRYRKLHEDRSNTVPFPSQTPVDPGVFAIFLIGFVLARRILRGR